MLIHCAYDACITSCRKITTVFGEYCSAMLTERGSTLPCCLAAEIGAKHKHCGALWRRVFVESFLVTIPDRSHESGRHGRRQGPVPVSQHGLGPVDGDHVIGAHDTLKAFGH